MKNKNAQNLGNRERFINFCRGLLSSSFARSVTLILALLCASLLFAFNKKWLNSRFQRTVIAGKTYNNLGSVRLVVPSVADSFLWYFLFLSLLVLSLFVINSYIRSDRVRIRQFDNISFDQVGGLHVAKGELREIVDYFKNPEPYLKRDAKMPRGILLFGPPGNGKTMLARSFASECGVPFVSHSGSDLQSPFIGLAAAKVHDLFEEARRQPNGCVIFIDEIDTIGRKRYVDNSHHEEMLNQLLNEMDGFFPNENIFLLAATNAIEHLDEALLRPGRFDRKILVANPSFSERGEIIKLASRNKEFENDIKFKEISMITESFSAAQVTAVFDEALLLAVRNNKAKINQQLLFEAVDRVILGPVTDGPFLRRTAYHEAGHAIVALTLPETTVRRITIVAHSNVGGYTFVTSAAEQPEEQLLTKAEILARVMSLIGGKVSEELIFGSSSTASVSDIAEINRLLDQFIISYGMSSLGIVSSDYSMKETLERERKRILVSCTKKVELIMRDKIELLELFARLLLERGTIQREDIVYAFANKISPYSKLLGTTKG